MKAEIISKEKNPFLGREEIIMEIKSDISPTYDEVKKEIGADENLIVIKRINNNFGRHVFIVNALVYESLESKNNVETIPKKVRKKMAEEAKKADDEAKKVEEEVKESPAVSEAPEVEEAKKVEEEVKESPAVSEAPEVEKSPAEENKEEVKSE
jgi:ribosomal protein S24E